MLERRLTSDNHHTLRLFVERSADVYLQEENGRVAWEVAFDLKTLDVAECLDKVATGELDPATRETVICGCLSDHGCNA